MPESEPLRPVDLRGEPSERAAEPVPFERGPAARDPAARLPGSRKPDHVAIIMDGNGRWAAARRMPRLAGHRAGAQAVRRCIKAAIAHDVRWLTLYAFSSENWGRPAE